MIHVMINFQKKLYKGGSKKKVIHLIHLPILML